MQPKGNFEEISLQAEDLQQLQDLLANNLPRAYQMLNIVKLASQGLLPDGILKCQFYQYVCPSDRVMEPFIVCIQKPNMCAKVGVIILPPSQPSTDMVQAFPLLLDWTEDMVFESCPSDFFDVHLSHLCTAHGGHLNGRNVKLAVWVLDNDTASQITVPSSGQLCDKLSGERYAMRPLEEAQVPVVMQNWHYSQPHSEHQIKQLLKFLPSCGLYSSGSVNAKETGERIQDEEELASSMIVSAMGLFNILYTEEKHRGKGYAQIVIQWLAQHAAVKNGLHTVMETEEENLACQACLKRCGFKKEHFINWYWYSASK